MRMIPLALLLAQPFTSGFEFFLADGVPERWSSETAPAIQWCIEGEAPPILADSIRYATSKWSEAACGKVAFEQGANGIRVSWNEDGLINKYPAVATVLAKGSTIFAASICVNAQDFSWYRDDAPESSVLKPGKTALNLDAFLMHEIGHALGLNHSDLTDSVVGVTSGYDVPTMNSVVTPKSKFLHLDDIAGIRTLYGIDVPLPQLNIEYSELTKNRRVLSFSTNMGDLPAQWNFGDGSEQICAYAKHRFPRKGVYTVSTEFRGMSASLTIDLQKKRKARRVNTSPTAAQN